MLADLIEEFSPLCPACRTPDEVWRIGPASGVELPAAIACEAIRRRLTPGGQAIVATPYDWSAAATPVASWIGGHSSRNRYRGEGPEVLRRLLAEDETLHGLRLTAEADGVPWHVRMHDRSLMEYRVHLLALMRDPGD